ncbi:heat-shock protein Hsp20 [Hypericibacter adhaerens]|jgi:molecular chaperone IbpA|uniref:Heat-shock protein Hsp20 n=2 Tax=Hypericibacter adhaerens TaxID=2602016 RepID=A0A5J6N605_9PROT|nr:heat-shock protein Hsp20 [Hypericibacter adhaerens]
MAMRTFDFSPLYRSTVGFDSMTRLLESALRADEGQSSYPPYNIEKTGENAYRITMAVAGFGENDITITAQDNSLVVTGKIAKTEENTKFLHRGIAGRAFERRFELAEHIRVAGASLVNGLLHVDLVKEVPEAKKPRTVKIETTAPKSATVLENQAA